MNTKGLPYVKLIYAVPEVEKIVASAAKATLSPREFTEIVNAMNEEFVEKWIRELIMRGHGSPLEHSVYVFEVVCSRVCSHQLVRHRHASYSQLSQRYSDKYLRGLIERACKVLGVEYKESYGHYIEVLNRLVELRPTFNELMDVVSEAFIIPPVVVKSENLEFLKSLIHSTIKYYEALADKVPYEDARYLLPQAVKTKIIVSMNARELVEVFLPLRMCARAQWEIRIIAWSLWQQLVKVNPNIFKYIGPRCVLVENRVRAKPCELEKFLGEECEFSIPRCPEMLPRDQMHYCILKAYESSRLLKGDI